MEPTSHSVQSKPTFYRFLPTLSTGVKLLSCAVMVNIVCRSYWEWEKDYTFLESVDSLLVNSIKGIVSYDLWLISDSITKCSLNRNLFKDLQEIDIRDTFLHRYIIQPIKCNDLKNMHDLVQKELELRQKLKQE
jgi:hypothetical protein